jgi:hypothetical protein
MEDGYVGVYVELDATTVDTHEIQDSDLIVSATEDVPRDWDHPTAGFYDPAQDEVTEGLGEITAIESE